MKNILLRTIIILWVLILPLFALAEVAQPTPMPGTFVHDFAGVISDEKKTEIQAQAHKLKDEYKTEIAVVTIDSLQGEDSFDYSMRMARSWGIGSKDNDVRGLLILVAVKDRKTAFRTSRHIEAELPDGVTGEISRRMNASFKNNDFGGGLSVGMSLIINRLSGVYEPQPLKNRSEPGEMPQWFFVVLALALTVAFGFILLLIYFVIKQKRTMAKEKKAWIAAGRSEAGYDKLRNESSSSSSSSSNSSSGSSYSGGSDFGGGGSDSSW